jgi:hypothetical protein
MSRALKLVVLALLLTSCAMQPRPGQIPAELVLLPPGEVETPLLLQQKVTLLFGQRQQQFLTVARFDRQRLVLVVLLPSGQSLLSLDYDGIELRQQSNLPTDLPGRDILAILQFAIWPQASLRAHYPEGDGWRLQFGADERRLLTESGSALTIAFQPGEMRVDNYLREYRVIVQTLESNEL